MNDSRKIHLFMKNVTGRTTRSSDNLLVQNTLKCEKHRLNETKPPNTDSTPKQTRRTNDVGKPATWNVTNRTKHDKRWTY